MNFINDSIKSTQILVALFYRIHSKYFQKDELRYYGVNLKLFNLLRFYNFIQQFPLHFNLYFLARIYDIDR